MAALPIRNVLGEWVDKGAVETLTPMRPDAIPTITDRQNDMAEPLLAIAQLAGGDWLQRLTRALQAVFANQGAEDTSTGVILLADIRDAFNDHHTDRLTSTQLLDYLLELEDRPWAEWHRGKPMTTNNLAWQLKKHGIRPSAMRLGGEVAKGYKRCEFEESWERYCSPLQTVTRLQPASLLEKTNITAVTSTVSSSHEHLNVTALPLITANSRRREGADQEVRI